MKKRIIILEQNEIERPEARDFIEIAPQLPDQYATDVYVVVDGGEAEGMEGVKGVIGVDSVAGFVRMNESTVVSRRFPDGVSYEVFFGMVSVKDAAAELGVSDSIVRRYVRLERLVAVKGKGYRGHKIKRNDLERFKVNGRRKWGSKNGAA